MSSRIALVFALTLASPSLQAAQRSESHEVLRGQCLLYAADPTNAWALAHGITGLGKTFATRDGRKATEVVITDYLESAGPGEGSPYRFAKATPDGTPVEPHTNLIPKTLVLAGVPPSTEFKTSFGPVKLGQIVEGVKRGFRHQPGSESYWRDIAWTLDLLAEVLKPGAEGVFRNGAGEKIDFNGVMDDALLYLEKAQADISEGMDKHLPQVDKRKQGIYAHTCGGLHLYQALGNWSRFGFVRKRWGARWDRQVEVLFYRLISEQRQYEAALQQAPGYRLLIYTQMVKFYGHFLETTGRLRKKSHFRPTAEQLQQVEKAKAYLDRAVLGLRDVKALESMDQLKKTQRQVYLDLIGDSCHATHGWDFWR